MGVGQREFLEVCHEMSEQRDKRLLYVPPKKSSLRLVMSLPVMVVLPILTLGEAAATRQASPRICESWIHIVGVRGNEGGGKERRGKDKYM